ncbi:MAG TPA: cupin domain-containing protein [Acidimicrobiia bacterium]|nr:cupin domain-containing protein [Acidimicrobiia bacterium]
MKDRFRVSRHDVPVEGGLRADEGWVDMRVQFLIDKARAESEDFLLGWTVLPPGARHDRHRHPNADEFFVVLSGHGLIYTDDADEAAQEGDVIFTRRGRWHGFNNTGDEDVTLLWGWSGAGSLDDAGYELPT